MKLNKEILKQIADDINSSEKKELRDQDYTRFKIYNGKTLDVLKEFIKKEFKKDETIEELNARLIPLNIVHKIITKLAGVYVEDPLREPTDQNESDQILLDMFSEEMRLNIRMKEANRYFKLFKRNLMEVFVDRKGIPRVRNLPRHTYEVYSFESETPEIPNVVAKIVKDAGIAEEQIISVWSDESFFYVDGAGNILLEKMLALDNDQGVNPYGRLPFIYINEASYSVNPLADDDLIRVAIAVNVMLSDLSFSIKYQTFSLIYTVGNVGDIPSNPSSIIQLEYDVNGNKPEVGTIKPEVDIAAIINFVTNIMATLLSSKSLKSTTINTTQSSNLADAASGISKMLDHAESVEDKKDQQAFFTDAELELWDLLSNTMIPFWRKQNLLAPFLNGEFSSDFRVSVQFKEPTAYMSEKERIENAKLRIDNNLSTIKREIQGLYPFLREEQVDDLYNEIMLEKSGQMQNQINSIEENNAELQPDL